VSPARLRSQLGFLADRGVRFVALDELVAAFLAGRSTDRWVAVTFDDALVGVHRHGVEILADLGVPATVFVVSRRFGTAQPAWYPGSDRTMTESELREVIESGVTVGSHTRTHPRLSCLDPSAIADELAGSRHDLEDLTGTPVDVVAYPSGDYDERVRAVAAESYRAAFTFLPGRIVGPLDPYRLPRIAIGSHWGRRQLAYALARSAGSHPSNQVPAVSGDGDA
jgi:peptidoglycan/xylan/chitin deacetylase (PgdA/CDA1 family)